MLSLRGTPSVVVTGHASDGGGGGKTTLDSRKYCRIVTKMTEPAPQIFHLPPKLNCILTVWRGGDRHQTFFGSGDPQKPTVPPVWYAVGSTGRAELVEVIANIRKLSADPAWPGLQIYKLRLLRVRNGPLGSVDLSKEQTLQLLAHLQRYLKDFDAGLIKVDQGLPPASDTMISLS